MMAVTRVSGSDGRYKTQESKGNRVEDMLFVARRCRNGWKIAGWRRDGEEEERWRKRRGGESFY